MNERTEAQNYRIQIDGYPLCYLNNRIQLEIAKAFGDQWPVAFGCGFANGYVKIPKGHKYYKMSYDELNKFVDVPYGLTFSGFTDDNEDYWTVGFDTMHWGCTKDTWPKERCIAETINLYNQLFP